MGFEGTIGAGAATVLIGGEQATRIRDLNNHGGFIHQGCETVTIGGVGLLASRVEDRLMCSGPDPRLHVVGKISGPGCSTVYIGKEMAARKGDKTLCFGPPDGDGGGALGDGVDGLPADVKAKCVALWKKYDDEAKAIIAPAGGDHQLRNKIINGAYSKLYLSDPCFVWAGLAGYASKQVGCALATAKTMSKAGYGIGGAGVGTGIAVLPGAAVAAGTRATAAYMFTMLGEGNRDLFLDVHPLHRFFQEQGFARMAECAEERNPKLTPEALRGFAALDDYKRTGDKKYLRKSLDAIAEHEQINILQKQVYDDWRVKAMLRINQTGIPLVTSPAVLVLGPGCTARPGDKVSTFDNGKRTRLDNVPERMDWIAKTADEYMKGEGGAKMKDDLGAIERAGRMAGGHYP